MKYSDRYRDVHKITVYCDGPSDDRHERSVVQQYALDTVLEVGGLWAPLKEWEYNGRRGRAKPAHFSPRTDPDGRKIELQCVRCGYREKVQGAPGEDGTGGGTSALWDALDTVASVTIPDVLPSGAALLERVCSAKGLTLDEYIEAMGGSQGDVVEVRDLVARTRWMMQTRRDST